MQKKTYLSVYDGFWMFWPLLLPKRASMVNSIEKHNFPFCLSKFISINNYIHMIFQRKFWIFEKCSKFSENIFPERKYFCSSLTCFWKKVEIFFEMQFRCRKLSSFDLWASQIDSGTPTLQTNPKRKKRQKFGDFYSQKIKKNTYLTRNNEMLLK